MIQVRSWITVFCTFPTYFLLNSFFTGIASDRVQCLVTTEQKHRIVYKNVNSKSWWLSRLSSQEESANQSVSFRHTISNTDDQSLKYFDLLLIPLCSKLDTFYKIHTNYPFRYTQFSYLFNIHIPFTYVLTYFICPFTCGLPLDLALSTSHLYSLTTGLS